jgi:hypothetical protein
MRYRYADAMSGPTQFLKLNIGWNAEPNAPAPNVRIRGVDVILAFALNHRVYRQFSEGQIGQLVFANASRYRLGATNDEGWYRGQCRFTDAAPSWGEFYEVMGDLRLAQCPDDWRQVTDASSTSPRHFLFYLRDETFECDANDWKFSGLTAPDEERRQHVASRDRAQFPTRAS